MLPETTFRMLRGATSGEHLMDQYRLTEPCYCVCINTNLSYSECLHLLENSLYTSRDSHFYSRMSIGIDLFPNLSSLQSRKRSLLPRYPLFTFIHTMLRFVYTMLIISIFMVMQTTSVLRVGDPKIGGTISHEDGSRILAGIFGAGAPTITDIESILRELDESVYKSHRPSYLY